MATRDSFSLILEDPEKGDLLRRWSWENRSHLVMTFSTIDLLDLELACRWVVQKERSSMEERLMLTPFPPQTNLVHVGAHGHKFLGVVETYGDLFALLELHQRPNLSFRLEGNTLEFNDY